MLGDSAVLLVELVALFLGVSFFVSIVQRRLGPERIRSWMGGRPVTAALKGIAIGFITPFCTYSAIPLLIGLRKAGVSPAGYVAFIVAAPVLDPILFGALLIIVGAQIAFVYAGVTFLAAMTLALTAQALDVDRFFKNIDEDPKSCDDESSDAWQGWRPETALASRAATRLLRTMAPLLVLGVAIGLAIEQFVPATLVAEFASGTSAGAIPVAAAFGTPLYINTELFVPIAHSLRNAGVGIGAIVALTIAGAGANLPEFVILSRLADRRVLTVFVGYVFAVAIGAGMLAQSLV